MLLKIVLANAEPDVFGYMFDLGISVELMFAKHFISNFSTLFMSELCLRIRDLYFIFKFYPTFRRFPGKFELTIEFDFYIMFKCCLIANIMREYKTVLLSTDSATDFICAFKVICKTASDFEVISYNYLDTAGE